MKCCVQMRYWSRRDEQSASLDEGRERPVGKDTEGGSARRGRSREKSYNTERIRE